MNIFGPDCYASEERLQTAQVIANECRNPPPSIGPIGFLERLWQRIDAIIYGNA